ncbi:hypothetical protein PPYR_00367 [Photinus pyralis]|uniref:mitogen-activated protein kinase n=3 Tax=Photinus pyralis TaxID=7054 RepID=A0A5N4B1C8_PHOPY|nr:mitogen-activated protein kinase 15-like [Photinus pyralis]XP_031343840.1 mitogen-activated protein kinase 15-like [Photinus pyralis]XP_031343849.1 mitogen-activated protein kinase 15-like [Photinus pyralis]XP_031343856.1 mitogen-activated protein kinase 15-like [Photinus pyralis]XP_031343911.1 mitogen-activated protein kinase 15-like [Photinus pyralis]XP_031343919.1 mitogen-activated protein kinase 15-like [Photinus pyralis]XP_031343928.1 mitogen-activated protein kinase 15-like [Photinus
MAHVKDKMSEIDDHILKRFDIQKRLGKGAYGIVWKAIDRKTREVVAVKKIFDAFRNQTDAQRTFREIMFLKSFKDHPNIIKLLSIHRAANNRDIYLGFEYMETDLHNVIKRGNILKDVHKRYIMYQMLKATKYIHSGNVIHRDQKPSNVLLDSLCRCKIADFGLARSLTQSLGNSPNDTDPTLTDYVATRWYRAPEILIANRKYTKGIDMWSLGCILAEMVLGKPIFPGTSTVNQVEKIMASIPVPSQEDIALVCSSGVGECMIKNSASLQRIPLKLLLGSNVSEDSLDLINNLLIFSPYKRLTAERALEHSYVSRFRNTNEEIVMNINVIPPLNDDIRLTVDDYRNKLYEIMSTHHHIRPTKSLLSRPSLKVNSDMKTDKQGKLYKDINNYAKSNYYDKERSLATLVEPKLGHAKGKLKHNIQARSEPKILKKFNMLPQELNGIKSTSDYKKFNNSSCDFLTRERGTTKALNSKSNVYVPSFNSFNSTHGIITQSALMELRAAGMR